MKVPNVDRTVAWSTRHDSTQTWATNNHTAVLNQVCAIIDDATLFLEKIHTQHQRSRFRLIREQMRKDPEVTKSIISDWSLDREVAFDEAPSPKLNDRPPNGSTSRVS